MLVLCFALQAASGWVPCHPIAALILWPKCEGALFNESPRVDENLNCTTSILVLSLNNAPLHMGHKISAVMFLMYSNESRPMWQSCQDFLQCFRSGVAACKQGEAWKAKAMPERDFGTCPNLQSDCKLEESIKAYEVV